MNTNTKWSAKDVITTVLLSVLLIVIQLLINMVCMASHFVSMVLSVGITCFVCAPVYFLMVRRVHKRFVSLLYMTLLGVVFLIMGDWFLLPYFIVVGLVCEAILWRKGSYDAPWRITAAWTVYSGLYQGVNLLPILAFWADLRLQCARLRHDAGVYRFLSVLLYTAGLAGGHPHHHGCMRLCGQSGRQPHDGKAFQ